MFEAWNMLLEFWADRAVEEAEAEALAEDSPRAAAALLRSLEARLARCSSLGRLPRILGRPTTLAHARRQQQEEPELWEAVGVPLDGSSKVPPAVQAAASLQSVLDDEMGGWRNTFG